MDAAYRRRAYRFLASDDVLADSIGAGAAAVVEGDADHVALLAEDPNNAAGYGRFGNGRQYDTLTLSDGMGDDSFMEESTREHIRAFMCERHGQCADDPLMPPPPSAPLWWGRLLWHRGVPLIAAAVAYQRGRLWCHGVGRWHSAAVVRTACGLGGGSTAPFFLACIMCVVVTRIARCFTA